MVDATARPTSRPVRSMTLADASDGSRPVMARIAVPDLEKQVKRKAALLKQRSDSSPGDRELRDEADVMIAKAKYFASNASFEAADRTVQILGSSGYSFETRAPRHLVDTRVCRIYEGTDEIMVQKIAVSLLGSDYEAYK